MTDESEERPRKPPIDDDHPAKRWVRRCWRRMQRRTHFEVVLLTWHTVLVAAATWEAWPFL